MEVKHTPGPWAVHRKPGRSGNIEAIGPLQAEEYAGSAWLDVHEADANLIAAAPDLLEVAQLLSDAFGVMTDGPDDSDMAMAESLFIRSVEKARAAIAKAEGRS